MRNSWLRKFKDTIAKRPFVDFIFAAPLTIICIALPMVNGATIQFLTEADSKQRLTIYAAGAGVMSLIAGFAGTAIAQYGSSSGPVVTALRISHGRSIRKNAISIIRWLLACAVGCIICMSIDSQASPRYSDYLFLLILLIAITKFARLCFLFKLILIAVDRGTHTNAQPPPPHELGPGARSDQYYSKRPNDA